MQSNKLDRLSELNKLWFRLHTPKVGDTVKFKIKGSEQLYNGTITGAEKIGNSFKYNMISTDAPAGPMNQGQLMIVECNGIKFTEVKEDEKNFKPL